MKVNGFTSNVGTFNALRDLLCVQLLLLPCKHRSCAIFLKLKNRTLMRSHAVTFHDGLAFDTQ